MTKIYKIPQYNLPPPKPTWGAYNNAQATIRKRKGEAKRILIEAERTERKKKGKLWYAYLLELEDDKYYLGITGDVKRRFKHHSKGKGALWTNLHKPVKILEIKCLGRMKDSEAAKIENALFREYFEKYGYDLRGGDRCKIEPDW